MKFFRLEIENEPVYFKAVTWYYARDIARRLWPSDSMEDFWPKMVEVDSPPTGQKLQVYEKNELNEVVLAAGYEFDTVKAKKKRRNSAGG